MTQMTYLPTAAEVLIVGCDPMISLPIHFALKDKILTDRLSAMIEGHRIGISDRADLIDRSSLALHSVFVDFKQYFKTNYSFTELFLNITSLDADYQKAARYLFIELADFESFILGKYELNEIVEKTLDRHLSLIDLTLKNLDNSRIFSEYLSDLKTLNIPEDTYLTWIASLPRSVCTLVFRAVFSSLLKYEVPLL